MRRFRGALGVLFLLVLPASGADLLSRVASPDPPAPSTSTSKPSAASRVRFDEPLAGVTLHGGDIIEIRWHGVPSSAEEMELLLSVDGGRRFSLRLTEELDADSRSFLWRVPSLRTERATLALRMGIDEHEILSPGPAFRIVPDTTGGRVALRWRAGELWQGPDDSQTENPDMPPIPTLGGEPERMGRLLEASFGFDLPRVGDTRQALAWRPGTAIFASSNVAGRDVSSRAPVTFPRRI